MKETEIQKEETHRARKRERGGERKRDRTRGREREKYISWSGGIELPGWSRCHISK